MGTTVAPNRPFLLIFRLRKENYGENRKIGWCNRYSILDEITVSCQMAFKIVQVISAKWNSLLSGNVVKFGWKLSVFVLVLAHLTINKIDANKILMLVAILTRVKIGETYVKCICFPRSICRR